MLIDAHVHIYPDKIAPKTIAYLAKKGNISYHCQGTLAATLETMDSWGVDQFLVCNIATNPQQQRKVNDFAIQIHGAAGKVHSLGSVHYLAEDALEELERIKEAGLPGVKFHPEYQDFDVDDERLFPIYEKCGQLGLFMLFHAGKDIGFPDTFRCPPKGLAKAVRAVPQATFIGAHMGGFAAWDDVYEQLCGLPNIYFDISFVAGYLSVEQARKMIRRHGADHILFGSDCPWQQVPGTVEYVRSLGLTPEEEEQIFYQNALRLLGE